MTAQHRFPRRGLRAALLAATAAGALAAGTGFAQAQQGGAAHHGGMAAAPGTGPAELGGYARDSPRGAAAPREEGRPALLADLGSHTWPAGTANPEAQAWFDQGYRLAWGFNHGEAARAFRMAQALDPACAMCLWGEAWALGPNINYPVEEDASRRALAVLEAAGRLTPAAGEFRTALIEAQSRRYSADPAAPRATLDLAYAEAMEAMQRRFPADPEVALLTADALMNLQPWDYWEAGGQAPKGATERILRLVEGVLGLRGDLPIPANPLHPGAIHLHIHMVEASAEPERAAPHAARLAALMPGAGHIVHMPSHIWYRLGLWRESLEANRRAAAADEALLARGGASLLYAQGYYPHNLHFVLASALMGGDGRTAVAAAERLAGTVSDRARREVPWTQPIAAAPYLAHVRFSAPEAVLALPPPEGDFPFVRAHWHYARGEALARLGRAAEAQAEAVAIGELAQAPAIAELGTQGVPGREVLGIAAQVVQARLAQAAGDQARAAALFAEAAAVQDRLPYMEPPFWYYPVHQSLGAALLAAGRPAEAEAAFREALQRAPNNGWAAAGLLRTAEARGDAAAAAAARALLERSWFGEGLPPLDRL